MPDRRTLGVSSNSQLSHAVQVRPILISEHPQLWNVPEFILAPVFQPFTDQHLDARVMCAVALQSKPSQEWTSLVQSTSTTPKYPTPSVPLVHTRVETLINWPVAGLELQALRYPQLVLSQSFIRNPPVPPQLCGPLTEYVLPKSHGHYIQYFRCRLRQISFEIGHRAIQCGVLPRRSSESTLALDARDLL